ncbi:proton-dependent oligopeptide transporter, POT family [Filimonas lacunae]|uniref:Proton-dependent oligopeptide transporter, POT family n=1 Tax=Filimonas lacunae TaxID=477680 RepID=A0A173MNQ9_9BACT|nr:peptide MFS transporter [Filimonas lacunae]BAV09272.1 di-/tripeptide transporter [Filimonas lacunae]SIS70224.1 proton-dependent oligopeptide transporter, POT family [Filimonas lacunae]
MNQTAPSKGHPKGLAVLFTTEMWERFNFYGMRALLSLFLVNALAFSDKDAAIIYGGFLGLSYLTPMLGGFISDRFLGNRNCIVLGGTIMALGQLLLFASGSMYSSSVGTATSLMWAALFVIIIGNGFFKPNISSMVGQLYPKGDTRLDSAFTIFYMGINVGAMLGMTICPVLGDVKVGEVRVVEAFKWGFLAAGAAMLLGTILFFMLKNKYVVKPDGTPVGIKPDFTTVKAVEESDEAEKAHFSQKAILGVVFLMIALFFGIHFLSIDPNPIKSWVYPFIYAAGISLAVLILTDKSITKVERDRILVIYTVAFFVIFFWSAFEQAGSSLTFIADKQTDLNLLGWNMPPSFVQNANSIFVIAFALPFSALWLSLQKKNREPGSTTKQSYGLMLLAIGYLIIAFQVKSIGNSGKVGVIWLIIMYLFHTLGELCLSPIGLSLVAKLAPKRFSSLLMGVWFIGNAAGYALAGTLGAILPPTGDKFEAASKQGIDLQGVLDGKITATAQQLAILTKEKIATTYPSFAGFTIHNLYEFFMVFVILAGVASVLLFAISGKLSKMMHGVK